jgi:hypothetical protein
MYQTILHYLDALLRNKFILLNSRIKLWRVRKKKNKKKTMKLRTESLVDLTEPGGEVFNVLC